jgi:preprotein translocase subunit SecG
MYLFITILILIASIFMIFIVLVQNSKGGGLAAGFSSSNQIMGVRKTTDFLEKATWGLAIAILALSILTAAFYPKVQDTTDQIVLKQEVQKPASNTPGMMNPGFADKKAAKGDSTKK